ncbi:MAG TPA: hypothetical protein VGK29_18400 [Paludibaculum sp.]
MVLHRDVIRIPSNVDYQTLIVFCQVEGRSGAAYFDDLVLQDGVPSTWKEGLGQTDPGTALTGSIVVDASQRQRRIPSTLFGTNIEWVWDGNGIWDSGKDTFNSDILSLARDSAPTLLRYPGGTFSDYYDWTRGIGPRSSRQAISSMPGGATSVPRFGTDEALDFARTAGGQMMITVNIVTGTPQMAADWVRYVNKTGLAVQYWEIGNESYVPGNASSMSPEQYALTFINFARAMRLADPRIKLMAIADENFPYSIPRQYPDWTERVLRIAGTEIDCLSIHAGYAPAIGADLGWPARTVYASMLGAPSAVADNLRRLSAKLTTLVPGRDIRIAMTEWGPYFQTDLTGRFLDHPKTIGAALYTASMLKTMIESDRTDIGNFFKLVDPFSLGAIGQRDSLYRANASQMVFSLVRKYLGQNLVLSQSQSPTFDSPAVGWVDAAAAVPFLESIASVSDDGTRLSVLAINQHLDRSIKVQIRLQRFTPTGPVEVRTLKGSTPDSHTGSALPAITGLTWPKQAPVAPSTSFPTASISQIESVVSSVAASASDVTLTLPPGSVSAIMIPGKTQ